VVEEKSNLDYYEKISEDVKYVTNSLSRLKILASLYESPKNMKELTDDTGLSYGSISSNMHESELRGYLYRESNKYYLSNSMKLQIENVLEFGIVVRIVNDFFNILDKHLVGMIPNQSVAELYLLGKANLIESDDTDAYRTYNYIENALRDAEHVNCVLPFYYENFNNLLNDLVKNKKSVEAMVFKDIFPIFEEKSKVRKLSSFSEENNFLLISTDNVMILGLFKDDGNFDQNRLLISKNEDSIMWGSNLFENFKMKNK
jgi:predicted transcriptional regulator